MKDPDSPQFARKGGVIAFNLEGWMAPKLAKELAEQGGLGVRSGCHCAHLLVKHVLRIPPLLQQLQGLILTLFPQLSLPGVTRVSLGMENSEADVDRFLTVLGEIARQPRPEADNPFASPQNRLPETPQARIEQQINEYTHAAAKRVYARLS